MPVVRNSTGSPSHASRTAEQPVRTRLLIIGNRGGTNIGESLERSARSLPVEAAMLVSQEASEGPALLRRIKWRLCGRRPLRLTWFSRKVARFCEQWRPEVLLTTGQAPVTAATLRRLGGMGIVRCNFATDDPWNPAHRAPWFLRALREYDHVFTPREGNLDDLRRCVRRVTYLPFGYDPELFYPISLTPEEYREYESDVMFAGGADADRVPYIVALHEAGLKVGLYGSYWERYRETRPLTRGQIGVSELRKAITASRVALCLVRRANRDGHSMRSFEVPAMRGCMLVESTTEHRAILGPDGEAVVYFNTISEMVEKAKWLLSHAEERRRLAATVYQRIIHGKNRYQDRLTAILNAVAIPQLSA
jgi:spore maturation protein CgeB